MGPVETPVRDEVEETEDTHQEDDGLGPVDDGSGIPGGAQPGDDGYEPPEEEPDDIAAGAEPDAEGQQPPTPPADLPDDGTEEDEEPSDALFVLGDKELGLKVGGRKPDSSVLKLKGGKIDLNGQFDRGDRFLTVTTLQVTADLDADTIETWSGDVRSTSKAQTATLCGITRLEEYLEERLRGSLSEEDVARVFDVLDLELPPPTEA